MPTIGLELCDAGFLTAASDSNEIKPLTVTDKPGFTDWPGFAYHEGNNFTFGRPAEDMWFVHPRRVIHTFWSKLAHDPVTSLNLAGRAPSSSELSFFFLREFVGRLTTMTGALEKIVF